MFAPGRKAEPDKPWPERLHSLRRSLGMDFMMFALELGVEHTVLRSWMLGEGPPDDSAVRRIEVLEREGMEATFVYREMARLQTGLQ